MVATVIATNGSDYSVALIEYLAQSSIALSQPVFVLYIDTGWSAVGWDKRIETIRIFALSKGFEWVSLKSNQSLGDLVRERRSFPTPKFQWCASLLKGLPLLEWLDEKDPRSEWTICIAKIQHLRRQPLSEVIESCSFHGDRRVWHPLISHSPDAIEALLVSAGLSRHEWRSLECQPCIHMSPDEPMHDNDLKKKHVLEEDIGQKFPLRPKLVGGLAYDRFSLGCADPFGCGL